MPDVDPACAAAIQDLIGFHPYFAKRLEGFVSTQRPRAPPASSPPPETSPDTHMDVDRPPASLPTNVMAFLGVTRSELGTPAGSNTPAERAHTPEVQAPPVAVIAGPAAPGSAASARTAEVDVPQMSADPQPAQPGSADAARTQAVSAGSAQPVVAEPQPAAMEIDSEAAALALAGSVPTVAAGGATDAIPSGVSAVTGASAGAEHAAEAVATARAPAEPVGGPAAAQVVTPNPTAEPEATAASPTPSHNSSSEEDEDDREFDEY